jgi:hypothetical protein
LSSLYTLHNNLGNIIFKTKVSVLDLILLSFNCSRPKRRLRSPMVEGNMGKFGSQIGLF